MYIFLIYKVYSIGLCMVVWNSILDINVPHCFAECPKIHARFEIGAIMPKFQDMNVGDMWFQQDGVICQPEKTVQLPNEWFPSSVISRFGDQNCPLRSCGLTPLDFFRWRFLNSECFYANMHRTTYALKKKIEHWIN